MKPVSLPIQTVLYRPLETPKYAHFITSGVASIVAFMLDGRGTEVGLIGHEGLVESLHLLGSGCVQTNGFMQVEGTALRIGFQELEAVFHGSDIFRKHMHGFIQSQSSVLSRLTACNQFHAVERRLARWLLMVRDRVGSDTFYLTQEFLAEMLGARRTSLALAAGRLQRAGAIKYHVGHIHIRDHEALQKAACECYPLVRELVLKLYR